MLAVVHLIAVGVVPLALQLRRSAGPIALCASVALVHVGTALLLAAWTTLAPDIFVWAFSPTTLAHDPQAALHDSYRAATGPVLRLWKPGAAWAGMAAILWLQVRLRALYYPLAVRWLFWAANLALATTSAISVVSTWFVLRRGAGLTATMPAITNVKAVAGLVLVLAFAGFAAQLADAMWRRAARGPLEC